MAESVNDNHSAPVPGSESTTIQVDPTPPVDETKAIIPICANGCRKIQYCCYVCETPRRTTLDKCKDCQRKTTVPTRIEILEHYGPNMSVPGCQICQGADVLAVEEIKVQNQRERRTEDEEEGRWPRE